MGEVRWEIMRRLLSTRRPGVDNLLDWMDKTDFYHAPASSKYHHAYPGGLAEHSLQVCDNICKLHTAAITTEHLVPYPLDSLYLVSLLHDLCKVNFYEPSYDSNGHRTYRIKDDLPMGHGEKSLWLIERHVRLRESEALAVRWHMGYQSGMSYSDKRMFTAALNKEPLVNLLILADTSKQFK